MRKENLILLVNCFLGLILSGVIWYGMIFLPDISRDELLAYEGWMRSVNEMEVAGAERWVNAFESYTLSGTHPRLVKAREESRRVLSQLLKCHELMNGARWVGNGNSWKAKLDSAYVKMDDLDSYGIKSSPEIGKYINDLKADGYPPDLRSISLQLIQWDFIRRFEDAMFKIEAREGSSYHDYFRIYPKPREPMAWISGMILFDTPKVMRVGENVRIQVRIRKQFQADLLRSARESGDKTVDSLLVGDIMIVKMIGEDFQITAFDDEEQGVTDDGYTQWEFDVTAKESGVRELYVKAGVIYKVGDLGNARKYFPSYERKINVEISAWKAVAGFASDRWEFLVSTFVIAVVLWVYSRLRKKRAAVS